MSAKKQRRSQKKSIPGPKAYNPFVATFMLKKGTQVEIRNHGDKEWRPYTTRKTVNMRTKKRVKDTLYMEYLGFEVRYRAAFLDADTRFNRY